MAELTHRERLQPALLDRLTDDAPDRREESRERRAMSLRDLRRAVLRDLGWLFNAGNLAAGMDLDGFPETARSVVNYGLPNLTGHSVATLDRPAIEQVLRQAILDFEPRILPRSLRVRAVKNEDRMDLSAVTFDIEGELWAQPVPERIYLRTKLDLEIGSVRVAELGTPEAA